MRQTSAAARPSTSRGPPTPAGSRISPPRCPAGLPFSSWYKRARRHTPAGPGAIVGIELADGAPAGRAFVGALRLHAHAANIGDVRSLAIHPATTTHVQIGPAAQRAAGISPGFVRPSVRIEDLADTLADLDGGLTDVTGVRVGHAQRIGEGWLTGVTVVLPPPGSLGAIEVRSAAPATRETDAPAVGSVRPLTGGSAFGLVAADGVAWWCADQGLGLRVGPAAVVPLVTSAAVYELWRGNDWSAVPNGVLSREAAQSPIGAPRHRGGGTGATIDDERAKGGVGTASLVVAAPRPGSPAPLNTTLVVVATDAALDHGELTLSAAAGHTGLARMLDPVHTLADSDAVIAVQTALAHVVAATVLDAVRSAKPVTTPAVHLTRLDA
ncbi:MAG TPA: P1 family peptidase [Cellulomonas sp.]